MMPGCGIRILAQRRRGAKRMNESEINYLASPRLGARQGGQRAVGRKQQAEKDKEREKREIRK